MSPLAQNISVRVLSEELCRLRFADAYSGVELELIYEDARSATPWRDDLHKSQRARRMAALRTDAGQYPSFRHQDASPSMEKML